MFDTRDPSFLDRFLLINALGIKGVNPVFGPSVRQLRLHFNSEFTLVWNVIRLHPLTRRGRGRERERDVWHFISDISLRSRTAGWRGRQNLTGKSLACFIVIFTSHQRFLVLCKKICFKESEVWRNVVSNKIIVTLVAQSLPRSFLSRPVAQVH